MHCQLERSKHDSLRRVVRKGRVRTGIDSVDLLFTTLPPLVKNVIVILSLGEASRELHVPRRPAIFGVGSSYGNRSLDRTTVRQFAQGS